MTRSSSPAAAVPGFAFGTRKTGVLLRTLPSTQNSRITALAFSADGRTLAAGDANGHISLWDSARFLAIGSPFSAHSGTVFSLAFEKDGRGREVLHSAGADGSVRTVPVDAASLAEALCRRVEHRVLRRRVAAPHSGRALSEGVSPMTAGEEE